MSDLTELNEYEAKVLRAIEPDYVLAALASLKRRGLIAFERRRTMRSVHLTDKGETAYRAARTERLV